MTRRAFTPDELRVLAKVRGPFFADTARAALAYCADVLDAADKAVRHEAADALQARRELAAAEARNATLTDDAARYRWLRDMTAAPSWYAAHANMGISCKVFDMRLDAEIARAAASISTKGDGHA